jgi:fucose permease
MSAKPQFSRRSMLLVLHPIFALTGIADAIMGPLLPSLAHTFHLSDSQSGMLLFSVFAGMATGALLCRGDYARSLTLGCMAMAVGCFIFPWIPRPLLYPFVYLLGVSVGVPMTAVTLFAGRNYPVTRAATLTLLNFTWSAGAMLAPLLASHLLAVASWRSVYFILAAVAGVSALASALIVRDSAEEVHATHDTTGLRNLRLVALFALFFFLQVGMENLFSAWISTYVLRTTGTTVTAAAAAAALFWTGFLASRGFSPLVLLRVRSGRLLQIALLTALGASILLVAAHSPILLATAAVLIGAALAPIFPVALAAFLDRARHSSDSRFILSISGFGGSVFPWLVGWISSTSGSLRFGLLAGPVTLLLMTSMLPLLGVSQSPPAAPASRADTLTHP